MCLWMVIASLLSNYAPSWDASWPSSFPRCLTWFLEANQAHGVNSFDSTDCGVLI